MKPIRTILIDPQPIFLQGASKELEEPDDIEVVGTGTTGQQAVKLIRDQAPDLAVIASKLPDLDGLEVLRQVSTSARHTIILTSGHSGEVVYAAMLAGARGYLLKWQIADLAALIRQAHQDGIVMCPTSLKLFIQSAKQHAGDRSSKSGNNRTPTTDIELSARERQVLVLMSNGATRREIATQLHLGYATVSTHVQSAYVKLGVQKQAAAIARATQLGLI